MLQRGKQKSSSTRRKKMSTRGERNFSLEFIFFDSVKLPKAQGTWKKRESAAAGWLSNFFPKTHVPQSKTLLYWKPMSVVSCVSNAKTTSFAQEPRKKAQCSENSVVDLFSKQTCSWWTKANRSFVTKFSKIICGQRYLTRHRHKFPGILNFVWQHRFYKSCEPRRTRKHKQTDSIPCTWLYLLVRSTKTNSPIPVRPLP